MNIPIQANPIERTSAATASAPEGISPAAWNCYSARNCSGKIINHKDPHNCKNSGGKSDQNTTTGQCTSW